jgi:hypothetical protein
MIPLIAPLLSLPMLFTGIGASLMYMGGTWAKVGIAVISTVVAIRTMQAVAAATIALKATWAAAVAGLTAAYAALTASIGAANAMASGGFIVAGLLAAGLLSVAYASQTSGHAADNLGNIFRRVSGDMTKAWGGMLAAIQGGDLEGALQIGWGGLKVVVAEVIGWAQIRWSEFVNALPVALATAWQGVANAIGGAITALVNGLFNMLGGLRKYFSQVSEDAMAMWDQITNGGSGVAAIRAAGQAERQQIDKETAMLRGANEDIENRNRADRQSTVDQATQESQGNVQNTRQGVESEIARLRAEQQRSIDDRMWALAEARGTGGPAPDSGARPPGLAGVAQSTFSAAGGLAFVGGGGVQNPQRETTQAVRRVEGVLEKLLAAMQRGFVLGA